VSLYTAKHIFNRIPYIMRNVYCFAMFNLTTS